MSLNGEIVLQARPPAVRMGKASVEIPIGSFLQATAMAEADAGGAGGRGRRQGEIGGRSVLRHGAVRAAAGRDGEGLSRRTPTRRRLRRCRRRCGSRRG